MGGVAAVSFAAGVVVGQTYDIPQCTNSVRCVQNWTGEKWDSFRAWEKSKRK